MISIFNTFIIFLFQSFHFCWNSLFKRRIPFILTRVTHVCILIFNYELVDVEQLVITWRYSFTVQQFGFPNYRPILHLTNKFPLYSPQKYLFSFCHLRKWTDYQLCNWTRFSERWQKVFCTKGMHFRALTYSFDQVHNWFLYEK